MSLDAGTVIADLTGFEYSRSTFFLNLRRLSVADERKVQSKVQNIEQFIDGVLEGLQNKRRVNSTCKTEVDDVSVSFNTMLQMVQDMIHTGKFDPAKFYKEMA